MKEEFFNKLCKNNLLRQKFLIGSVFLHNMSYKAISRIASLNNQGAHPKHEIMKYYQFFQDNVTKNDSVLDVGCGNGYVSSKVAEKSKRVVGMDIKLKNIEIANKNYQRDNLAFLVGDATSYNFNSKWDIIILSNVLEHIKERVDFLIGLHKLSDKILIRVPMVNRDWLTVYKKKNGFEYRLDRSHYIEYTIDILKKELKKADWKLTKCSVQFGEIWGIILKK